MYEQKANQKKISPDKKTVCTSQSYDTGVWTQPTVKKKKKISEQSFTALLCTQLLRWRERERAGVTMKGKGVKQRLRWNRSPSWQGGSSYSRPRREQEEHEEEERDIYLRFNKWRRQPHRAEQHRPPPHHTQTQTDRGAIFSHRSDWLKEVTGISLSHRLLSDRLPLSPTSSFPSIWSPSFYLANLIFRRL